ncbi:MAG: MotA/TolQ/ExbB proton channel family protein [Myxococcota bacterium]|jgi:biopolymer transport protein ExbB
MFDAQHLIDLLIMGWLSNVPLAIGSIWTLSIFGERWWKLRGLEDASRVLASQVIERVAERDVEAARRLCEESDLAVADMLLEGLSRENVAVEDLERVFATIRAEIGVGLKRGLWIIGTVGSLAPFVGLFGTVIGIIRAFGIMSESGETGFQVVASSLSEALIATAAGLGVAIIALLIFNYLNIRVASVTAVYARASERLVQALLYVESTTAGNKGA